MWGEEAESVNLDLLKLGTATLNKNLPCYRYTQLKMKNSSNLIGQFEVLFFRVQNYLLISYIAAMVVIIPRTVLMPSCELQEDMLNCRQ